MNATNRARMLVGGSTLVIVTAVVAGLVAIGSPGLQRDRKLDQRRVSDLSQLSRHVAIYWNDKKELAPDLDALAELPGFRLPSDPQTGAKYEYAPTGTLTFKVCAVFALDTATDPQISYYPGTEKWLHGIGHTCFSRNVDKIPEDD